LIILGVLAGIGALVLHLKAPTASKSTLGKHLLENLPANEISTITLKDPEGPISLVKKSDRWVVEDRFGYPADFSKIAEFVRKLKNAKIGRQFESSAETLKRLSLKFPDDKGAADAEKGTQVQLEDGSGKTLVSMLLGKPRETGGEGSFPDGHYVRVGDGPTIYLIDAHFAHMQKEPSDWLDKALLKVDAKEVKRISCLSQDGKRIHYVFERPAKGKALEPKALPENRKISESALDRLARSLSSLRIEDVTDPSDASVSSNVERSNQLQYLLFNGMTYHVYPGKTCSDSDGCYLKLGVTYHEPAPLKEEEKEETEEQASKKEETETEKTPEERTLEANQLNDRFSPWVYVIPKWQHEAFMTDLEKLLEKPEKQQKVKPEEEG
jgi:hypothetical protein